MRGSHCVILADLKLARRTRLALHFIALRTESLIEPEILWISVGFTKASPVSVPQCLGYKCVQPSFYIGNRDLKPLMLVEKQILFLNKF